MTSVTIQDFQQTVAAAAHVSELEPVFLVENGEPQRVLIDIAEYRLTHPEVSLIAAKPIDHRNMAERLAVPEDEYFEWEPERLDLRLRLEDVY